jgi:hypothetical protein
MADNQSTTEEPVAVPIAATGPTGTTGPTGAVETAAAVSTTVATTVAVDSRFKFKEVNRALMDTYNSNESNGSMICDVIVLYLKSQKLLYAEAKTFCEQKLHFLMLPSIFITVLGSVVNLVMKDTSYGTTIVSSLNAFTAFLLAVINYLKLDARAEAHRTTTYKLDKLESDLLFNSGRILFIENAYVDMKQLIDNTHKQVKEIKETNPFVLPEHIRYSYPVLCGMNVFTEVKEIQTREMIMTNELKDMYNDTKTMKQALERTIDDEQKTQMTQKLRELEEAQRTKLNQVLGIRTEYKKINTMFEKEIKKNRDSWSKRFQICCCLKV